jgi:hypothetical protein
MVDNWNGPWAVDPKVGLSWWEETLIDRLLHKPHEGYFDNCHLVRRYNSEHIHRLIDLGLIEIKERYKTGFMLAITEDFEENMALLAIGNLDGIL